MPDSRLQAAEDAGDLALNAGDEVTLRGVIDSEWSYGEGPDGTVGVFPRKCVAFAAELWRATPLVRAATATAAFKATTAGDLSIGTGDEIAVKWAVGTDWLFGEHPEGAQQGVFPRDFVRIHDQPGPEPKPVPAVELALAAHVGEAAGGDDARIARSIASMAPTLSPMRRQGPMARSVGNFDQKKKKILGHFPQTTPHAPCDVLST